MPQTATSQAKPQANSEETNLRYSGEFFDKDLKQQYLRARYYNQNNSQFNRLDPYSGDLANPQSLHKYAYCHQDPVNHIDPSGNFSLVEVSITTTILFSLATGLFTGFHAWVNQKTSPLVAAVLGVIAAVVTFCGLFFAVQIAAFFGTFFLFATLTQQVIMCGFLAYGVSGVVEDMFEAVKIVSTKKPIGFFRRFVAAGFVLSILGDILLGGVKSGSKGAADDILRNTLDDAAEVAIESATRNSAAPKTEIPTINNRYPINSKYAGKTHPSGVKYNDKGFPDFSPHAKAEVKIDVLTGNRALDNKLANQAAGFGSSTKAPKGYTWHHVEDGVTMQLVPVDIHNAARHTGGAAVIKNGGLD